MLLEKIFSFLSNKEIAHPIFILGCGRSGTTIFGTSLSKHQKITYLNERRDLWFQAYPETDIWTAQSKARNGRMCLTAADTEIAKSQKLRQLFYQETVKSGRPILVEKLPINNFRTAFISSIFPDAKFIHIYRNGLEVASSIKQLSEKGEWFGANDYKWQQLSDYAKNNAATAELLDLCDNFFYKGLLEWRLSTETAVNFLASLPEDKYMEFSYASFIDEPVATIKRVFAFIGVDDDPSALNFVRDTISRKTHTIGEPPNEIEQQIGGMLLPLSVDTQVKGITAAGGRTK